MTPPINVDFWTRFYETAEDPDRTYHQALENSEDVIDRAEQLWNWKDLGRGVTFESVAPVLEATSIEPYLDQEPANAVDALGGRLVDEGALSNATVVTPAFILHLADSDSDHYSRRFPIFDASVWTAFVFLTGRRSGDEKLPIGATTSTRKYGEFVDFFEQTLPNGMDGRIYERALFRFGAYISGVPEETIADIDSHLGSLEAAIDAYSEGAGDFLVST